MCDDDVFFEELKNRECYIYIHTINDVSVATQYFAIGGVYTDNIRPEQMEELDEKIVEKKFIGYRNTSRRN